MLEALLEKFIINYLGRYFSGLDKKKIDIGVWKGDIAIENLALNHDLLTTSNLPIEVVYSYIARLALKVPWTRLSSSSVELTVEDVFLLVRIKSRDEWKDQDFNTLDCKYGILKKCADTVTEKLASLAKKPSQKSGPPGHIEKILIKIIDNLQITLKNVHIRVECADNATFSAGIHLANLKIMTTDESFSNLKYQKFEATSTGRVVRKLAKISSFQIYWNSKPSEYWCRNPNPDSLYLKFKTFNLLEIESYRIILLAADLRLTINEKGGSLMNKVDSKYTVELDIPLLDVKLTTSQIKDLLTFLANMDNYKSKKALSLEDVRYGIFRPAERIRDAKIGPEYKALVKKWWMYAIRAAWHKQKVQSGK